MIIGTTLVYIYLLSSGKMDGFPVVEMESWVSFVRGLEGEEREKFGEQLGRRISSFLSRERSQEIWGASCLMAYGEFVCSRVLDRSVFFERQEVEQWEKWMDWKEREGSGGSPGEPFFCVDFFDVAAKELGYQGMEECVV